MHRPPTFRFFLTLICLCICMPLMTGCSWLKDWNIEDDRAYTSATTAQPRKLPAQNATQHSSQHTDQHFSAEHRQAVQNCDESERNRSLPDSESLLAGVNLIPVTPPCRENGKSKGKDIMKRNIAPGAGTPEERLAVLEQTVAGLQRDYGRMAPAFKQLLATNEKIEHVLTALESPQQGKPQPDRPQAGAEHKAHKAHKNPESLHKPSHMNAARRGNTTATVKNIRIGEHGHKTRLVFDLSAETPFSHDLDNQEGIFIVQFSQADWQAQKQIRPARSPLIASTTYQKTPAGGTALAVQLRKKARILEARTLPASGGKGPRLFIDLAPAL